MITRALTMNTLQRNEGLRESLATRPWTERSRSVVMMLPYRHELRNEECPTTQITQNLDSLYDQKLYQIGFRKREKVKQKFLCAAILPFSLVHILISEAPTKHYIELSDTR